MDARRRASQESNINYVSEYGKYIEGNDSHGIFATSPCIGIYNTYMPQSSGK